MLWSWARSRWHGTGCSRRTLEEKSRQGKVESMSSLPINLLGIVFNGSDSALIKDHYSYYHY